MYEATRTSPELCPQCCRLASTLKNNCTPLWWTEVSYVLGYLKRRLREKSCLRYRRRRPEQDPLVIPISGLFDASFNNTTDCRSMTGWLLFAGDGLIHWHTGLTRIICLSTTESEAYALSDLVKEVLHVVQLTAEIGLAVTPVALGTDNRGSLRNAQGGTCARTAILTTGYSMLAAQ